MNSSVIEELDRTIQGSLLGVQVSIDNLNETMKAILQEMKKHE
jgi:hypothetical protein|tara:strand:- start:929 stop:1057 length:129 start_codon:yes stop_codon:yes gene_type:complete